MRVTQSPAPGSALLRHGGDVIEFTLRVEDAPAGRAVLRTSLGGARRRRRETIESMDAGRPPLALDWSDIAMREVSTDGAARVFSVRVPLVDTGSFHAKCCFFPNGGAKAVWPEGADVLVKTAPAWTSCWDSIYCAFPRQFGPDRALDRATPDSDETRALEERGYTVIPRGGTFRSLAAELDVILRDERFRIIQLLPVHPTPTVFARMGRFGSPFAGTDFLSVDPALAEFDRHATPLDQFRELVDAVHTRGARVFIDLPANHTGWASTLQIHHPEWFKRAPDGAFASPGAWGVVWEDLVELDYSRPELRAFIASVFEFWCEQGVDGFRCDAGYMVPGEVWRYVTARVRESYPDTVFLLEGLGGKISVTRDFIAEEGLDWAYSEIFQTEDRSAFEHYLPGALELSQTVGPLAHYAETHDNNRLASRSPVYARMRTALAALVSQQGCFGITNGVEWFAAEKVDVHRASALRWGSPDNQISEIRRLNTLLATHPAFAAGAETRMIQRGGGNTLAVLRTAPDGAKLLVLVNLDACNAQPVDWDRALFSGGAVLFETNGGAQFFGGGMLPPGGVICLSENKDDAAALERALAPSGAYFRPAEIDRRSRRIAALRLRRGLLRGKPLDPGDDPDAFADVLAEDPLRLVASFLPDGAYPPVTTCSFPDDARRVIPLPFGNFLLVRAKAPFRAHLEFSAAGRVIRKSAGSFPLNDGTFAAFIDHPSSNASRAFRAALRLEVLAPGRPVRETIEIDVLPRQAAAPKRSFSGAEVRANDFTALLANGRGAMSRVRARWGEVRSQYDAILAANADPRVPCDRTVLFTRCRAWIVNHGFSSEIDDSCLRSFEAQPDVVRWEFAVPAGTGRIVPLRVELRLARGENRVTLAFTNDEAEDADPVQLILRPDVESRSFHCKTKAFAGAEREYPAAVSPFADGFTFRPAGAVPLEMRAEGAVFRHEPEWHYMVANPVEAERGQDGSDDLFSPGWFSADIAGGASAVLSAFVPDDPASTASDPSLEHRAARAAADPFLRSCEDALRAFIAKRDDFSTVIAGYPWFLDWGRDTFIAMRGMIAAGLYTEALEIVRTFGAFEDRGTLPNMICGADASNRDTSDAPLWYCTAVRDLCRVAESPSRADLSLNRTYILMMRCGEAKRTVSEIVLSIVRGYLDGTPNGIRVDPATALVYSPAHFTWMDTNHPAGTPRSGYPVEIQALWIAALSFAAELEPAGPWASLAERARASFKKFFDRGSFLSDCLHCEHGYTPAAEAVADDHVRCNQLFAITLGAIDDPALGRRVLASCERLLVPGAIRTLAPGRVEYELPVRGPNGLLNDPAHPYWGRYEGDEDTRRKPAYHNGTAWPWPFPSYAEALLLVYGESARPAARSLIASGVEWFERDCIGHLPEIADGDAPHAGRGCDAQAWSASEFLRVAKLVAPPPAQ